MELTFNEVKAITDTLPVGLYANRRISIELGHDETSWYDPQNDTILIAYEQVTQGLNNYNGNPEVLIRSNHYHEVGHAILTPKNMSTEDIYNIFEDERLETLLNKYFYNINFKDSIYAINGCTKGNLPPIQNVDQAFYYLVRFRVCYWKDLLEEVSRLIIKYKNLTRLSDRYHTYDYERDIERLYNQLLNRFQNMSQNQKGQANGQGQNQMPFSIDIKDCEKGEQNIKIDLPNADSFVEKILDKSLNAEFDNEIFGALSILFEQYRKKNSKGSAINGYSGILNPRAVQRTDYKYFERPSSIRGGNQFGTFHLNLFVDVSGSYKDNETKTNQLIKALCLIETKNPNFSFDVVTTDTTTTLLPKEKRFIKCDGGTYLGKNIEPIFRKLQLPNTYNYNIVLFDGDAYCSGANKREEKYSTQGKGFSVFTPNNTTIISDNENKSYIEKYAPTTKTIYTKNYTEELFNNVITVIAKALN